MLLVNIREEQNMLYGRLKWFNKKRGYGFITDDVEGKDIFVHITQVQKAGLSGLPEGRKIGFDLYDDRGRTAAGNLSIIGNVLASDKRSLKR